MSHYRHQPVAVIPASKRKAVNAALERQGYGPNMFSTPVVGRKARDNATPTHYILECPADDGLKAALKMVLKGIQGGSVRHAGRGMKGKRRAKAVLAKRNLKRRPIKKQLGTEVRG